MNQLVKEMEVTYGVNFYDSSILDPKEPANIFTYILSEQITDDLDEALFADILSLNFEGSK